MALVVETGAGLPEADSFFAVADADLYFAERGMAEWSTASPVEKDSSARQAADYLGFAYGWKGQASSASQRLCWPRVGVYPSGFSDALAGNTVPRQIREAAMLLAYLALTTNLLQERAADRIVESERKELTGVGAVETRYAVSSAKGADLPRYPNVDALVAGLIVDVRSAGGLQSRTPVRR